MTSKTKKKKGNESANKVTRAMILQAQMAQMEKQKKKKKSKSKVVEQNEDSPLEENINKLSIEGAAQTVDEAIDVLSGSSSTADRYLIFIIILPFHH